MFFEVIYGDSSYVSDMFGKGIEEPGAIDLEALFSERFYRLLALKRWDYSFSAPSFIESFLNATVRY